jgi:hypothetical protein
MIASLGVYNNHSNDIISLEEIDGWFKLNANIYYIYTKLINKSGKETLPYLLHILESNLEVNKLKDGDIIKLEGTKLFSKFIMQH